MAVASSPSRLLCLVSLAATLVVACSSEAPQDPPPSTGTAGTGGQSNAGAGGAGTGGTASAGSDAGGSGGGNIAGQGAGGTAPSCFNPGPGVCCPTEECYTAQELTELGCSAVDLHTEGCPHPVELPIGNCHWYEASTTTKDGKCCYTFYSGNCCGP